ncbi:MAG: hypothetical protein ACK4UK_07615 [Flavobacterium sp.]
MFPNITTPSHLFSEVNRDGFYSDLILQLNKDFNYANESLDLSLEVSPEELCKSLHEKIYVLISQRFASYLNLLYIIDVSESEIKKLDGTDVAQLSEQVMFLILKREWQKVWFRKRL